MPPVLVLDRKLPRAGRALGLVTLCAIAALLVAMAAPSRADAARVRCADTFRVLHDDHVGRLSLPRGTYRITILASGRPECPQAAALFTRFLEDYDGILPGGWRVGAANSTFLRAPGVGFHVARVGGNGGGGEEEQEQGGGGRHPLNGSFCPAPFRVLHNDRIGALRLPAATTGSCCCSAAASIAPRPRPSSSASSKAPATTCRRPGCSSRRPPASCAVPAASASASSP